MGVQQIMITEAYQPFEWLAGDVFSLQVDTIVLASGQNLVAGAILAKLFVGTAAGANAAGNAGNPTIGAITVGANAEEGLYTIRFTAATTFEIFNPYGSYLGTGTLGTAVNLVNYLGFTLTAGGTAAVAGDVFNILVTEGNSTYTASVTGSDASAILGPATNASAGAVTTVAVTRMAEFEVNMVSYGALNAGQQQAANAALAKKFIIARGGM